MFHFVNPSVVALETLCRTLMQTAAFRDLGNGEDKYVIAVLYEG